MKIGGTYDVREIARRLERDIQEVSRFSGPGPGVTQLSFTPEYWFALGYLEEEFGSIGFETGSC